MHCLWYNALVPMCWRVWLFASASLVGRNDYHDCWRDSEFCSICLCPAVLVTPLGALSIIVSAVLAHFLLKEKLHKMGMLGCLLCTVGSTVIVLHAPDEMSLTYVQEIWELAIQPGSILSSFD